MASHAYRHEENQRAYHRIGGAVSETELMTKAEFSLPNKPIMCSMMMVVTKFKIVLWQPR